MFNRPFLGSHTNNEGEIPLGHIWPPRLPTYQISSNSEGVICKTLVNWYGITHMPPTSRQCSPLGIKFHHYRTPPAPVRLDIHTMGGWWARLSLPRVTRSVVYSRLRIASRSCSNNSLVSCGLCGHGTYSQATPWLLNVCITVCDKFAKN